MRWIAAPVRQRVDGSVWARCSSTVSPARAARRRRDIRELLNNLHDISILRGCHILVNDDGVAPRSVSGRAYIDDLSRTASTRGWHRAPADDGPVAIKTEDAIDDQEDKDNAANGAEHYSDNCPRRGASIQPCVSGRNREDQILAPGERGRRLQESKTGRWRSQVRKAWEFLQGQCLG